MTSIALFRLVCRRHCKCLYFALVLWSTVSYEFDATSGLAKNFEVSFGAAKNA
jgi:hypothetical protein